MFYLSTLVEGGGVVEEANLWTGWWDEPTEGNFSDFNTGETLTEDAFQPWYAGEPNGNKAENCVIIWPKRNAWNDQPCTDRQCGFCELEEIPVLHIRGTEQ